MQMGFASCANLSQAADLLASLARRGPSEIGQNALNANWIRSRVRATSSKRDMPCGCQEMRQRGKNQEWKMENSKRVAQGYPQGYRTRTRTRTSHDGRVETEAEAEAAESVLEPESEAAFRVHFQMKAATNFKVDYVCRSHLSRIPIPIPPACTRHLGCYLRSLVLAICGRMSWRCALQHKSVSFARKFMALATLRSNFAANGGAQDELGIVVFMTAT